MVLSYGKALPTFTHAIVLDMNLNRFGKLKIDHTDCFQWNDPGSSGFISWAQFKNATWGSLTTITWGDLVAQLPAPSTARTTLAFLKVTGEVQRVNFDLSETQDLAESSGVLLLGKYQYIRNKFFEFQWADVENVRAGLTFNMYLYPTLDGKTLLPAKQAVVNRNSGNSRRYASWTSGQNMSFLFMGAFNMTTVVCNFTLGGDF
jgi:hypothetical protein